MPQNDEGWGRSLPRRESISIGRRKTPIGAARRGRHRMRYDVAAVQAEMRRMSRHLSANAVANAPDAD